MTFKISYANNCQIPKNNFWTNKIVFMFKEKKITSITLSRNIGGEPFEYLQNKDE